jgi:hypothetical protein
MNEVEVRKLVLEHLQVYAANYTNSADKRWAAYIERYVHVLNQRWLPPEPGKYPQFTTECGQYIIYNNGAVNRIKWLESFEEMATRIAFTY